MLFCLRQLIPVFFLSCALQTPAAVSYVDLNSTNPASPYTNWMTAATNIQEAIEAATDGDMVRVTNGMYRFGRRVVYGALTNRIAVTKAVAIESLNGPLATGRGRSCPC
jgi:hypothetical protein